MRIEIEGVESVARARLPVARLAVVLERGAARAAARTRAPAASPSASRASPGAGRAQPGRMVKSSAAANGSRFIERPSPERAGAWRRVAR